MFARIERFNECDRLHLYRLGSSTAAIMGMLGGKKDGTAFTALDVFPELREPIVEYDDNEDRTDAYALLAMFEGMASVHNKRAEA